MNKRAAVAVAGGLTGALASGLAGYSVRVAHQPATSPQADAKPIVKTKVRTITIHKKAKVHPATMAGSAAGPIQTVVVHRAPTIVPLRTAPQPPPPVHHTSGSHAGGGHDDGGHDDGGHDDDGHDD